MFYQGKGTTVILWGAKAYKVFWGCGATASLLHELACVRQALQCPVWGNYVLPLYKTQVPFTVSSYRGVPINKDDKTLFLQAQNFLEGRLSMALRKGAYASALDLIPMEKLSATLGRNYYHEIQEIIKQKLSSLVLPAGPAHGDLHCGNLVRYKKQFYVIDWSQFSKKSSPVFDQMHWNMSRLQAKYGGRWIDLLLSHQTDILQNVDVPSDEDTEAFILAYVLNRIALEGYYWQLRNCNFKKAHKYKEIVQKFLMS